MELEPKKHDWLVIAMIYPYCGNIDKEIAVPELTKKGTKEVLGTCEKCGKEIWAIPVQKKGEKSQLETVKKGERREEILVGIYLEHESGDHSERRESADDIDREIFDLNGNLIYFLEVKERSCSLNAYHKTQFPFAKIESGKKLIEETGLPVFIVLKFIDCWSRHRVLLELGYEKGQEPFAPGYRPWQRKKARQVPVLIPVEILEILPWRDQCEDIKR